MSRPALAALACAVLAAPLAHAADPVRTERVKFAPGATSATVKGQVKGYGSVEYLVGARKGQAMNVSLKTGNASNYFNLWAPGVKPGEGTAISAGGVGFAGVLTETGDYRVQVYLMRNAARRNETANYTLTVSVK